MPILSDQIDDYCFLDFETRSLEGSGRNGDLKVAGTYRYAKHARPILLTYAIGTGPVRCLDLWEPFSITNELVEFFTFAQRGEKWFVAWNTGFDRAIWNNSVFAKDYGPMQPEMTLDAMAQALVSNLPGDLEHASTALGGPGKQKDGRELIGLFSPENGATPESEPEKWQRFKDYAVQDTEVLRTVFRQTMPLSRREWTEYWTSERINERGIQIDEDFCRRAHEVHKASVVRANARLQQLTGQPGIAVTTVAQLAKWVHDRLDWRGQAILEEAQDLDEEGDRKAPKIKFDRQRIGKLLAYLRTTAIDPAVIEVLELREYGGSSSPVKFDKIVQQHDGGRIKGQYVFCGAGQTGRFSAKGVQVHNLPRDSLNRDEETAIELINRLDIKTATRQRLADELRLNPHPSKKTAQRMIHEASNDPLVGQIIDSLDSRKPNRPRGEVRFHTTPETMEAIRVFAAEHPDWSNQQLADHFHTSLPRVAEALKPRRI